MERLEKLESSITQAGEPAPPLNLLLLEQKVLQCILVETLLKKRPDFTGNLTLGIGAFITNHILADKCF
jgi:hypothetical protein